MNNRSIKSSWLSGIGCILIFSATIQQVKAHGELLIRIAAATQQIETTTDNLAQLYLNRGELYREDQNWSAATADYDRAAQLDPKLDVTLCRAKLLVDSGQFPAARTMLDDVLLRSPTDGEALMTRGRLLVKLNQSAEGTDDFVRGLALLVDPQPGNFLETAQALVALGKTNDALLTINKGVKQFGPILLLQEYALNLERGQKHYESAIDRIDTILTWIERKENWFAQRGALQLASGRRDEARKSFQESLAAIEMLPPRLQQSPSMKELRTRIQTELNQIADAAAQTARAASP